MRLRRWAALLAVPGLAGAAAAAVLLQQRGVTPRALGPYIERRSAGHNPVIVGAGRWLGQALVALDRGAQQAAPLAALGVGAQPQAVGSPGAARLVASEDQARAAFAAALPGDAITFVPGIYRIGARLTAARPGTAEAPVTVRAALPGTVFLEFDTAEGFGVRAPYWRFENLTIRGACAVQEKCEHAFHVVGAAHHFAARNNTILDFNAHFKINGEGGAFPDHGLIEANTLGNDAPRLTAAPVTPIDLVAASDWTVRANLVRDFVKAGGNRISYGAFAKGGGARTVFERNVVLCEQRLRGHPGQRIGLGFGGGGTEAPYCRDGKCITEQEGGIMRANLVASCSDVGIYLNSAAASTVADNTVVDTGGIDVRFAASSATLDGNLVDGAIRARDGALLRLGDNLDAPGAYAWAGYHPQRRLLRAPEQHDYDWRAAAPRRAAPGAPGADLCGRPRPASPAYGAFEDFKACLRF